MPWCEACSRYLELVEAGELEVCPICGRPLGSAPGDARAPWHFKLLVAAATAYLGFRALQGVLWLIAHL